MTTIIHGWARVINEYSTAPVSRAGEKTLTVSHPNIPDNKKILITAFT